jgi:hypothetical protein
MLKRYVHKKGGVHHFVKVRNIVNIPVRVHSGIFAGVLGYMFPYGKGGTIKHA